MIPRGPRDTGEACDVLAINHLAAAYADAVSRGDVAEACQRATRFDRTPTGVRGSVRSVADGAVVLDLDQYAPQ